MENCSVVFQGAVGACSSRPRLRQLPRLIPAPRAAGPCVSPPAPRSHAATDDRRSADRADRAPRSAPGSGAVAARHGDHASCAQRARSGNLLPLQAAPSIANLDLPVRIFADTDRRARRRPPTLTRELEEPVVRTARPSHSRPCAAPQAERPRSAPAAAGPPRENPRRRRRLDKPTIVLRPVPVSRNRFAVSRSAIRWRRSFFTSRS